MLAPSSDAVILIGRITFKTNEDPVLSTVGDIVTLLSAFVESVYMYIFLQNYLKVTSNPGSPNTKKSPHKYLGTLNKNVLKSVFSLLSRWFLLKIISLYFKGSSSFHQYAEK